VRTSGDPLDLAGALRKEVWAVDPDQPVLKVETMEDVVSDSIWRPRFSAWIFSAIGGLALLLTCAGVYSVVAYTATLRSREVGIRVALGATPSRIFVEILREGALMTAAGVAFGVAAAALLTRFIASLLFGVATTDAFTFVTVPLVLACVSAVALWLPARRATNIDPMEALRQD